MWFCVDIRSFVFGVLFRMFLIRFEIRNVLLMLGGLIMILMDLFDMIVFYVIFFELFILFGGIVFGVVILCNILFSVICVGLLIVFKSLIFVWVVIIF